MIRSVVRSTGGYLPARIVDNDELCRTLDTSDAWIRERTGIAQRRIAAPGEFTSDLAVAAARAAFARADLDPRTVDLVIVATSTPDHTFPAAATAVHRKLELRPCPAFDLQAVCAGFAYAVGTADAYLRTGLARRALVIGAETFSRILDWSDRGTAVLFGDGAGAVILDAIEQPGTAADRGVLAVQLAADGARYNDLYVDGGPSSTGTTGHLRMNGREVFRHAVVRLAEAAETVAARAGIGLHEVDLLVPHQANARIIDAVGRRLGFAPERVVVTVGQHANTSAASIPLALALAVDQGRLRQGHLVIANALGGGFTWGAFLLRW